MEFVRKGQWTMYSQVWEFRKMLRLKALLYAGVTRNQWQTTFWPIATSTAVTGTDQELYKVSTPFTTRDGVLWTQKLRSPLLENAERPLQTLFCSKPLDRL